MRRLGWAWTCLCVAATVALLPTAEATRVRLRRGGYEGVVVAISPEVSESQELVEAIKDKIKVASRLLFNATRKTVFFKKVTILLPRTWRDTKPDSYRGTFSYEESDIRVAPASSVFGHQPYTLQPEGCGRPGQFSHFTPEFLTNKNLSYVWGPPERLMVFEWAKLRWGVFEEIGYRDDETFPLYYRRYCDEEDDDGDDDGEGENREDRLTANLCVVGNLEGRYVDSKTGGENCSRREEECDFLVKDFRANLWPVSLDEEARRSRDVAFCDDEEGSAHRHNSQAPNKHNLRCKGESWWAVMRRHPDFKDTLSRPSAPKETQFKVVQQIDARVVLVLDLTQPRTADGSLAFARRWLYEGAEAGSYVGVLLVLPGSREVVMVAQMTRVTLSSRLEIIRDLEKKAARGEVSSEPTASVRKGLQEALKMLTDTHFNAVIIVVSSNKVYKKDLVDFDPNWTTPVYTISSVASDDLREFVEKTKGKFVFLTDPLDEDKQRELVVDVARYVSQPRGPRSETPISFQNEMIWGKTEGSNVQTDGTPGTYVFRLSTNNRNHVLEPPTVAHSNGKLYQAKLQAGSSLNQWTVVVDDASTSEPGAWVWRLNTTDDADSFVRLETLLEPKGPVVQVESWIEPTSGPDGVTGASAGALLYAKVTQGEMPVLGAVVEAIVSSAENSSVRQRLRLFDTGHGADAQTKDGLYSCFVPPFANGNLSVEVKVMSNNETKVRQAVQDGLSLKPSRKMCCGSSFPSATKTRPVPYMNRRSHAGTFAINYNLRDDRIPPFRVTDLRAKGVALSGFYVRVRLAWTATGDDCDFGQASRYTVRASRRRGPVQAETCVDACSKLEPVFEAGAASSKAGQRVTASVYVPNYGATHFFFAVTAYDEVGNASPPSNVVAVGMRGSLYRDWRRWAQILQWVLLSVLAAVGLALPLLLACDRHQCRFLWQDETPPR
ncbi:calcium-activated chloride channel regulator 1-like isoform X2 [Penaeus chinensis]|uniref:calcium-activated chloride channel regulator 1-like isoform X2 n=1 Tax=Penaeus chinensis TaxID=139456 RepID=UPI001FB6351F|nr:calcium-activated chloride channel regulator 1-like isoform X2 [Penaeus chinensis]